MSYQNDEVYLKQVFSPVMDFFGSIVGLMYQSIQFFIKRIWLFLTLTIIGIVGGYFLDYKFGTETIKQEVVIEPNMNSIRYIYNLIDAIPERLDDEKYLESIGVQPRWIENIGTVTIEPITAIEDIFDYLHNEYQDKNFQYTIQDFSKKEIESDKFTYFYQYHLLEITFVKAKDYNKLITEALLKSIYNNGHFKERINLRIKQAKESIESNKSSLSFIDNYLTKVIKKPNSENKNKELVIVSDESQTNKLASLIEQKTRIMNAINADQNIINLGNEVFSVVGNSDVVVAKKRFYKRKVVLLPIILCFLVSLGFLTIYVFRQMGSFVKKPS